MEVQIERKLESQRKLREGETVRLTEAKWKGGSNNGTRRISR